MCVVFQSSLTSANYENFVNLVTTEITVQLEKAVGKTTFNRVSFRCHISVNPQPPSPLTPMLVPPPSTPTPSFSDTIGEVMRTLILAYKGK